MSDLLICFVPIGFILLIVIVMMARSRAPRRIQMHRGDKYWH